MEHKQQQALQGLIRYFAQMPGLGTRSAKRLVYHLLNHPQKHLTPLLEKLSYMRDYVRHCDECHAICFAPLCDVCNNPQRDKRLLCIVEKTQNIDALEQAGVYKGLYHVLGGVLSVFDNITPDDLQIASLLKRIETHPIQEIIFALPATQEGRTTIYYLTDMLKSRNITLSLPAQGMPLGSDIEYLDTGTLMAAFDARKHI